MEEKDQANSEQAGGINRLKEEHQKVVDDCVNRIQHWEKLSGDYEALRDRLGTLPDRLSYDIMVPFGPLAFMPGKLVRTNEVTVLLGDNWFAKCSAKQAQTIVDHRMKHVKKELEELTKTKKNFEARVGLARDLESMSASKGDYVDIREEVTSFVETKGKQRIAHKPNSKPKLDAVLDLEEEDELDAGDLGLSRRSILGEEELWARLDELERLEELQDKQDRLPDHEAMNGEETSSSSEEDKETDPTIVANCVNLKPSWSVAPTDKPLPTKGKVEDEDVQESDCLPTIFFSHTVEPKKVRINTGKNTTMKFSQRKEQKEQSKRKKKSHSNGHHEVHKIATPADIYRVFVDVRNGEPIPRKSILKTRSRENSVCSDTSESSAADFEERRVIGRSFSHDDMTHSDTSDGITEEESPTATTQQASSRFEAFSGTVVEKDPVAVGIPHLHIIPPALPTIMERKHEEVALDVPPPQEAAKRVSKFKAARLQQK